MAVYLDSSALVKLVIQEAESAALRRFLRGRPIRVSSALARVEVMRAVCVQGPEAQRRAQAVLDRMRLLRVDDDILAAAAVLDPGILRSLDAIHLASARAFGSDLEGVVTYDMHMSEAAGLLGCVTFAPA